MGASRVSGVPVLVMTAFGSEETAIAALQRGAASYVPKKNLARELFETLQGVLSMVQAAREQKRLSECLTESRCSFRLENDAALVVPIVAQVQDDVIGMQLLDENESIRMGVALEQAILNAIFHGNLELSFAATSRRLPPGRRRQIVFHLLDERRHKPPFQRASRVRQNAGVARRGRVHGPRRGPGFDHSALPKAGDIATLERDHHRGLFLIANFMDEVRFNDAGNEITMVKTTTRREVNRCPGQTRSSRLVVDDSATQALDIRHRLVRSGFEVQVAGNGVEALKSLETHDADIVLTDLVMPEMDGLELVNAIRRRYPGLPVILLTAHGSEEIAAKALRKARRVMSRSSTCTATCPRTLENVLALARANRSHRQMLDCLTRTEAHFFLDNDPTLIPPLVGRLRRTCCG